MKNSCTSRSRLFTLRFKFGIKIEYLMQNTLFCGFLLNEIWKLSSLQHLNRLEITISTSDCSNNMPELVYVLRDFPSLRYLIISWGVHIDLSNIRIARLLSWLISALEGDNANIHVQICYALHSNLYSSPPANSRLS